MNEKKEPNLDELLNSYLDGELDERQHAEIKRLIAHDQQAAAKLKSLQKTKELLGALSKSPPPPEILHGVRAHMERKMLRGKIPVVPTRHAGAWHLMLRRTLAAAAMIGLISVLALLVFNILKPESPVPDKSVELYRLEPTREVVRETAVEIPRATVAAIDKDTGTGSLPMVLVLRTAELRAVNSAIGRAIYDTGLLNCTTIERLPDEHIYSLRCDRESTAALASDLKGLWERFDIASLSLAKESFGRQVTVDNVTAEQVMTLLAERNIEGRAKLAKDFAALNAMSAQMPGRDTLAAIQGREYDLLTVDKPVLTSSEGRRAGSAPADQAEKISLTIIVRPVD
jgi:hypothetical protein